MTEISPGGTTPPAGEAPAVEVPSGGVGGLFPSLFRAVASPDLIDKVTSAYELDWTGASTDIGGDMNLNLALSGADGHAYVLRVYTPWVNARRVRFIQALRSHLCDIGLPFAETLATKQGQGLVEVDGRVAEVERHVAGGKMTWDPSRQLRPALAMLGRVHAGMARAAGLGDEQPHGHENHVEAEQALGWARRAASVVRSWADASPEELALAGDIVRLALVLRPQEAELAGAARRQLVHGDFWEHNVLFDSDDHISLVMDLDFCGSRPRIDDLAYTLSGTVSALHSPTVDPAHWERLRLALDAYSQSVAPPLSSEERRALPLAIARTVLFVPRHLVTEAELGAAAGFSRSHQRRTLEEIRDEVAWSLALAQDPEPVQALFTG
jgi:Ser/Thr protein kinase RdoA (MazF antagonist)